MLQRIPFADQNYLRVLVLLVGMGVLTAGLIFLRVHSVSRPVVSVRIGETTYWLEVSKTEQERRQGLSGRDEMCASCGMLFLFEQPRPHSFWMKGMRFSLDIFWVADGKVVFIKRRIPADSKEVFFPDQNADSVIEVNAGMADTVKLGDHVEILSE